MFKGAIHIHSRYSDGERTLAELRDLYRAEGCSFLAMTDHAESFHAESLERYVRECGELSGPDFLLIPGLEFACLDRMHVLGIGAPVLAASRDPQDVFAHVERHGGLAVVAHPLDTAFPWIESFTRLPGGIEVWNSKYDGRYAPRVATFDLLSRLKLRRPDMRAFFGQDMHWRRQYRQLYVEVAAPSLGRAEILEALTRGRFEGVKGRFRLPATGELTAAQRLHFLDAHQRSDRIRGLLKKARGLASRWGMPVPPALKAQLRRIF